MALWDNFHNGVICRIKAAYVMAKLNKIYNSTTIVEKSPSASYPPMDIGASFWWRDALQHQPVRIREGTLESGNLFSCN